MREIAISFFIVCISCSVFAQYDHEAVFSDKTGDELRELLVDNLAYPRAARGQKQPYFYSDKAIDQFEIIEQGVPATSVLEKFGLTPETYISCDL